MDTVLSNHQSQSQHLALSPQMLQSIHILNLDILELHEYIAAEVEKNPVFAFPRDWEPRSCGAGLIEDVTRATGPTLRDELRFQLHVSDVTCEENRIGEFVIDCIDERGYLAESVETISELLKASHRDVERVVDRIRTFEPAGVGASSLTECLGLQLRALGKDTPCVLALLGRSLQDLARSRFEEIAKKTGFPLEEIREAHRLIQSLDLYPGRNYDAEPVRTVVPEIAYSVENGLLTTRLCNELPPLEVDEHYGEEIADDEEARRYIRHAVARAHSLLHCIGQRDATLIRVAERIADLQRSFFLAGSAPVPLTLKEVAEALDLNVSTVSRSIGNRYFEFDRRVHPFKELFPSRLRTGQSDAMIRARIRRLIDCEDKAAPLSDRDLVDRLKSIGIEVARRTVAKYRTEAGIETSGNRRNRSPDGQSASGS